MPVSMTKKSVLVLAGLAVVTGATLIYVLGGSDGPAPPVVVSAGAEPQTAMRLAASEGDTASRAFFMSVAIGPQAFILSFGALLEVDSLESSGGASVSVAIPTLYTMDSSPDPSETNEPADVDADEDLESDFVEVKGGITLKVSDAGFITSADWHADGDELERMISKLFLESAADLLRRSALRWPGTPVGVGAHWYSIMDVEGDAGSVIRVRLDARMRSWNNGHAEIELAIAHVGTPAEALIRSGVTTIEGVALSGTGAMTIDVGEVMPVAALLDVDFAVDFGRPIPQLDGASEARGKLVVGIDPWKDGQPLPLTAGDLKAER